MTRAHANFGLGFLAVLLLCLANGSWAQSSAHPEIKRAKKHVVKPVKTQRARPKKLTATPAKHSAESSRWQAILSASQPSRVVVLCKEFERDYPKSSLLKKVRKLSADATQALAIQRVTGSSGDNFEQAKKHDMKPLKAQFAQPKHLPSVPENNSVEASDLKAILAANRPSRVVALCEEFERNYPHSPLLKEVRQAAAGASKALAIQRVTGLSGDTFEIKGGDPGFERNLHGAARGDSNAAFQIAQAYLSGSSGTDKSRLRVEQWLRFSAELGHPEASWKVAQLFNADGLIGDAAHYEKRAMELGYKPPARLPTRGY